jgi:hypothetical protein
LPDLVAESTATVTSRKISVPIDADLCLLAILGCVHTFLPTIRGNSGMQHGRNDIQVAVEQGRRRYPT